MDKEIEYLKKENERLIQENMKLKKDIKLWKENNQFQKELMTSLYEGAKYLLYLQNFIGY